MSIVVCVYERLVHLMIWLVVQCSVVMMRWVQMNWMCLYYGGVVGRQEVATQYQASTENALKAQAEGFNNSLQKELATQADTITSQLQGTSLPFTTHVHVSICILLCQQPVAHLLPIFLIVYVPLTGELTNQVAVLRQNHVKELVAFQSVLDKVAAGLNAYDSAAAQIKDNFHSGNALHRQAAVILVIDKLLERSDPLGKDKLNMLKIACEENVLLSR